MNKNVDPEDPVKQRVEASGPVSFGSHEESVPEFGRKGQSRFLGGDARRWGGDLDGQRDFGGLEVVRHQEAHGARGRRHPSSRHGLPEHR
jgi:hypothetical protein